MKERLTAVAVHIAVSFIVAAICSVVIFYFWYPAPFDVAIGVSVIFATLLAVDVVLGPLFTFIVFKKGKASLKFDLAVIALVQVFALFYGMVTMFEGRPAFVVFSKDRFELVRALEIDPKSAERAKVENNADAVESWLRPRWVAAMPARDGKRRQELMFAAVGGGADWPHLPELFTPLSAAKEEVLKKAKPLNELSSVSKKNAEIQLLLATGDTDYRWLPLRGRVKDMVVIVDAKSVQVQKIIDVDPWP